MTRLSLSALCSFAALFLANSAFAAVKSAELYTGTSYQYGRFEARLQFAAGDGVVSSFFLWKDGSEKADTFWNELDFEKLGAECRLETNAFYGNPEVVHAQRHADATGLCTGFHTYTYEWTPDYIAWLIDGEEIRRETGATAAAYAENATAGMQIRFNIWPGDATFGGNFSPSILPVYQHIDWVQYSSYADGEFQVEWRDDFDSATLDPRWLMGSWGSPLGHSIHDPLNVTTADGEAVLALTQDATGTGGTGGSTSTGGSAGAPPPPTGGGDGCSVMPGRPSGTKAVLGALGAALMAAFGRRRSRRARAQS
jgi:hypothetical protein